MTGYDFLINVKNSLGYEGIWLDMVKKSWDMTGYDSLLFTHFIGDMIGYDRDMTGYGITYYITYFLNE